MGAEEGGRGLVRACLRLRAWGAGRAGPLAASRKSEKKRGALNNEVRSGSGARRWGFLAGQGSGGGSGGLCSCVYPLVHQQDLQAGLHKAQDGPVDMLAQWQRCRNRAPACCSALGTNLKSALRQDMAYKHKSWKEHRDTTSLKAGGLQAQRDSTKKRQGPASLVRVHNAMQ